MTDKLPEIRKKHPFLMYDMIKDTPEGVRKTIETMEKVNYSFLSERLYLTGNGTAYHAATLGAQILWDTNRKWRSIQAFELEHYHKISGTLVGFSHTGKTKSTIDAIKSVGRDVETVGISHEGNTPIIVASKQGIVIGNSPDKSLCNTKAFFDNSFAALEIAKRFGRIDLDSVQLLSQVESGIRQLEKPVAEDVERMVSINDVFVLGAGPNFISAREAAQKIRESTHLHAEGIELEEFNHGCTAVIDDSTLVVLINTPEVNKRVEDIVNACGKVGTKTFTINGPGDFSVELEYPENRYLYPILVMVPMYYLAYYLALKLGINPDYLRFEEKRYLDYDNVVFPPGAH